MQRKRLLFGKGLLQPTLGGHKKITLRRYRPEAHAFTEGEVILGEFADDESRHELRITADTELTTFDELTDAAAKEDGFESAEDAFDQMQSYYPDLRLADKLAIIRFELA